MSELIAATPKEQDKILDELRWKYAKNQVNKKVLEEHFNFLNQAVVICLDAQGMPLMTTTGIDGSIGKAGTFSYYLINNLIEASPRARQGEC